MLRDHQVDSSLGIVQIELEVLLFVALTEHSTVCACQAFILVQSFPGVSSLVICGAGPHAAPTSLLREGSNVILITINFPIVSEAVFNLTRSLLLTASHGVEEQEGGVLLSPLSESLVEVTHLFVVCFF